MAWIDVGTDEPQWVPDDAAGYTSGDREGYVTPTAESLATLAAQPSSQSVQPTGSFDPVQHQLWLQAYEEMNYQHIAQFGQPMNRAWTADADATRAKQAIDDRYLQLLAQYNQQNGTNLQPDQTLLGASAQPNAYLPGSRGSGSLFEEYAPLAFFGGAGLAGLAGGVGAAGAGAAELGTGELAGLAAGAGLGETGGAAGSLGFMTPAGAAVDPALAAGGFAGSVGAPLATGAAALPEWATTAGAVGGAAAAPSVLGTGGGGAGGAASGSALSRIIDGTATTADWVSVLGTAGATGLGMFSANQLSNSLTDLANRNRAERAPFLAAGTSYLDPQAWIQGPGQEFTKGTLQGLSAQYGNPIGSPTAMGIATDAAMRNWLSGVNTLGTLGLSGQGIQANLGAQAAGAQGDVWGNLAGGISNIVNPPRSLSDLLREYKTVFA